MNVPQSQDKKSDFETALKWQVRYNPRKKNLYYFLTEIYKVKNNTSPDIMRDIFDFQENEN